MTAPDLVAAVAAHNSPFDRVVQCHHPRYAPIPDTYDEVVAELQVTREELNDVMAEHENFAPLLRSACEANAAMAREFAELLTDRERIRAERDDLALRFEYVTDENAALREEIAELRAAAGPTEVVLADGGTAVLG